MVIRPSFKPYIPAMTFTMFSSWFYLWCFVAWVKHFALVWWSIFRFMVLTHWSPVTHTFVGNITIIGSENVLAPVRWEAITWGNAGILSIGPLGIKFKEILIKIRNFSLKKIRLKMPSAKCCPFRPISMCWITVVVEIGYNRDKFSDNFWRLFICS